MKGTPLDLLKSTCVLVSPEAYRLVSLQHADWSKLLDLATAGPRMTAPFMILMDNNEVTLMLDDIDFEAVRPGLRDARIEPGYRLLTFDIELDLTVVGFLAEVSRILAD